MLTKAVLALALGCLLLYGIYLLGMAIYNHWLNSARKDAAELAYQSERLETLLRKAQKNEA